MKTLLHSFGAGLLFALGLGIAGMTRPDKVINFLDFLGDWDPSLAFVMVGAIAVYSVAFRVITKRPAPMLRGTFSIPTRRDIDLRLVAGAALFGAGWGIGGYCPGPGLASMPGGGMSALVFVGAMVLGMQAVHVVETLLAEAREARPAATPEPADEPAQN